MAYPVATNKAQSVIANGQYVAVGVPYGSLTPSTITAMVGFQQGGGAAIDIAPNVSSAMTVLSDKAATSDYPANVQAATALSNLTSTQAKLFNPNDCGGFGTIVSQAQAHCDNSKDLISTTNNLKTQTYPDYGSGIEDTSSMADRGMENSLGSLSSAGTALGSGGKMWNGTNVKNIGKPGGIAESIQRNKLGNATGLNQKLTEAGVDINDVTNPAYEDKVRGVLAKINDPSAINSVAEQLEIDPYSGLPEDTGTDSTIYSNPSFSSGGTARAELTPRSDTAGITSLLDLGDWKLTADPAETAGLTTDTAGIGQKLSDLGGGEMLDNQQSKGFFDSIQKIQTPVTTAAHPTQKSLMSDPPVNTMISNLTGVNAGPNLIPPTMRDILGPVAGNSAIDDLAGGWSADKVTALNQSTAKAETFIAAAQLQASSGSPTQNLGEVQGFATSLHKYGEDTSADGVGSILTDMANPNTKYGESVKASLVEGKNNKLLAANGVGPLKTNPYEGVQTYVDEVGDLYTDPQIKLMGGS